MTLDRMDYPVLNIFLYMPHAKVYILSLVPRNALSTLDFIDKLENREWIRKINSTIGYVWYVSRDSIRILPEKLWVIQI